MRSREEIETDVAISNAENNGRETMSILQLEVLLDIRDQNKSAWGIYCPQHYGSWDCDSSGRIYAYPSKEIADAHIEYLRSNRPHAERHLWEAVEFGKQEYVDPDKAPVGTELCPVRNPPHFTKAY